MLFELPKQDRSIIKVIGVGGGGSNAVSYMYTQGIQDVDFAICNTDIQALHKSPVPIKIQLGPHLTEGMGAGTKPEIGKQSCIESIEDIRAFLNEGTKMLFVTAGMGGGTGTGAAPIIAKAAKEMDILTVGIVTLPFKFEGLRRYRQALEGLEQLKKNVDSILVISNDRLRQIYGDLGVKSAFGQADGILTTAAKGIAEIITIPGLINVDFEDVNTVMRDSGPAIMGNSVAEGEGRARKAIHDALNSPLLEENDIRGAQHILLNISSGEQEVTMDEVEEITTYLQEEAGYGTDLVFGVCTDDETLGKQLSITLIATGFEEKNLSATNKSPKEEKIVVALDQKERLTEEDGVLTGYDPGESIQIFDLDLETESNNKISHLRERPKVDERDPFANMEMKQRENEEVKNKKMELEAARRKYLREKSSQPIDNPKLISDYENEPAYLRRNVVLDPNETEEIPTERFTVSVDEKNPLKKSRNQFLHDNVD